MDTAVDRAADEARELEALQQLEAKVRATKTAVASAKLDDMTPAVAALKAATAKLKALTSLQAVVKRTDVAAFVTAYDNFGNKLTQPLARIDFRFTVSNLPRSKQAVIDAIEQLPFNVAESRALAFGLPDMIQSLVPKTSSLYQALSSFGGNIIQWQDIADDIMAASAELEKLNAETIATALKSDATTLAASLDALVTVIQNEEGKLKVLVKRDNDEVANLDKKLAALEASKVGVISALVPAVFWMIAAIVILFVTLRIFPHDLAERIIVERTLVELLSMGFLLVTVIILGTSRLLGAEALSALLGTIAGYIFGKEQARKPVPVTTAAPTGQPPAGGPPAPGHAHSAPPASDKREE